jgi:hypothetical protein
MTATAEMIDRALMNNVKPRDIAAVYGIALKVVMARVRIKGAELDRQEMLRKEQERRKLQEEYRLRESMRAKVMKTDEQRLAEWCALDIRYQDDPRSPPFNLYAANLNASRYARRVEHHRTLGGVVAYGGPVLGHGESAPVARAAMVGRAAQVRDR